MAAHERPPNLTTGVPTRISVQRENRPLSAGMPLLEAVGKPMLAGNCQDENQKRKFISRLWHLIVGSLFLPLRRLKAGETAHMPLVTCTPMALAMDRRASPTASVHTKRMDGIVFTSSPEPRSIAVSL
jgi:hypothetical protein